MKDISQLQFKNNLLYAQSHEWLKDGETITIGISDYAQDQLGDIVFVELPEVGTSLTKGDELGTVESVKAVSELYTPVSGEVIEINEALEDNPGLINESPYDQGWMVKIKANNSDELKTFMDKTAYVASLTGE